MATTQKDNDSWKLNPELFFVIYGKYKKKKLEGINYVWNN